MGPTCVTAPAGERTGREGEGGAPASPWGWTCPWGGGPTVSHAPSQGYAPRRAPGLSLHSQGIVLTTGN